MGIAWFDVVMLLAVSLIIVGGATAAAVAVEMLAGPLVAGWMGLAVLASATHLVPSVGPGDPHEHARQRAFLGRWAPLRLAAADVGVAGLSAGLILAIDAVTAGAMLSLTVAMGLTAALLIGAVASGIRDSRSARP